MGEHWEHEKHGEHGKQQPDDLKYLIYDSKHPNYDSKHSICQSTFSADKLLMECLELKI